MRGFFRWLLFVCGTALVCLRLYPSDNEWVSGLFHDESVYAYANDLSLRVFTGSGFSLSTYGAHADNLTTLTHAVVIILEAAMVAFVFFYTARKIR